MSKYLSSGLASQNLSIFKIHKITTSWTERQSMFIRTVCDRESSFDCSRMVLNIVKQTKPNDLNETYNPLPDDKILDWSKLNQSADDNFEFGVNSRKFSKLIENTVGKGEIARYEQFLIIPWCFQ